jgi:hypothetical protein
MRSNEPDANPHVGIAFDGKTIALCGSNGTNSDPFTFLVNRRTASFRDITDVNGSPLLAAVGFGTRRLLESFMYLLAHQSNPHQRFTWEAMIDFLHVAAWSKRIGDDEAVDAYIWTRSMEADSIPIRYRFHLSGGVVVATGEDGPDAFKPFVLGSADAVMKPLLLAGADVSEVATLPAAIVTGKSNHTVYTLGVADDQEIQTRRFVTFDQNFTQRQKEGSIVQGNFEIAHRTHVTGSDRSGDAPR